MSKSDNLLNFLLQNVGKWACSVCGSGSNQPAATFRTVKNMGYRFEEVSPNRWGKMMFCPRCGMERTHYKLLSSIPEFAEQKRLGIDSASRKKILGILGGRDAFTGASIASTPEIDHKTPWTRLEQDYDVRNMSDAEIPKAFQLLTREHNLLKDRMCDKCKKSNVRPPFMGIRYWYSGNQAYCGSCVGCGWYDGVKWRESLNKMLLNKK